MITIQNLHKTYSGKHCVLDGITFTFENSHIYGLTGPNGCGKTTLMRCICGFTHPSSGYVTVEKK